MKRCPSCHRTYTDVSLNFCLEDGTPLLNDTIPHSAGPTDRYPPARNTSEPPPTEIYRPNKPLNQPAGFAQARPAPQWSAPPQAIPRKKSSAVWWVLAGIAVVSVIGIGIVIMLLALASMGSDENNANDSGNTRVVNRNHDTNINNTNESPNLNANTSITPELPAALTDDFGTEKWRTGTFQFGDIWYADDEFHMRAKEKTYLVMYAPGADYNTEEATVRVTARSVDGVSPTSGYGLIVHGEKSPDNTLEDYALLVYSGEEPQYQVVMHKNGVQKTLVSWTKSSIIRSGTNPNQLEIRSKGDDLSFFINGRYLTRITNTENNKRGVAGLYTSETGEVAFDDLEISR
jgi:hypothetical protein